MFAAVETGVAATVGAAVAGAVGAATVSTAVATAVGVGTISAGITLAEGGSASDALKSAVISGGAGYVGGMAGQAAGSALPAGTSQAVSNAVSAAASGGTSNALSALAQGKDVSEALKAGATGAATAGLTSGTIEAAKAATTRDIPGTGLKVPTAGQDSLALTGEFAKPGVSTQVPGTAPEIGTGTGLKAGSTALFPVGMGQYTTQRGDVISGGKGTLQPAYSSAADIITPTSLSGYTSPQESGGTTSKPMTETPIGKRGEQALSEVLSPLYAGLFTPSGAKQTYDVSMTGMPGAGAGSQALAQALRLGDPGAPLFGTEKEGKRKNVWNVASLKVKDETGA